MSKILGHDVDGKPLRAGDRVRLEPVMPLAVFSGATNHIWTVTDEMVLIPEHRSTRVVIRSDGWPGEPPAGCTAPCQKLRKIEPKSDHQPADQEFTEWLKGVGQGVPA